MYTFARHCMKVIVKSFYVVGCCVTPPVQQIKLQAVCHRGQQGRFKLYFPHTKR